LFCTSISCSYKFIFHACLAKIFSFKNNIDELQMGGGQGDDEQQITNVMKRKNKNTCKLILGKLQKWNKSYKIKRKKKTWK